MPKENKQLLKIKQLNIEAYVLKVEGQTVIKPFEPNYRRVVNSSKVLRDFLDEINLIVEGLYEWRKLLLNAKATLKENKTLTLPAFKVAYLSIRKAGLEDWLKAYFHIDKLYAYITTPPITNTKKIEPTNQAPPYNLQSDIQFMSSFLKGFIWWAEVLVDWHYHQKISQAVFEDFLITLARVDLWIIYQGYLDLSALYYEVTGKQTDVERLNTIYQLFNPYA